MDKTPRRPRQQLDGLAPGKVTPGTWYRSRLPPANDEPGSIHFYRRMQKRPCIAGPLLHLQLERQIVVRFLERTREILEVCARRTPCSCLGTSRGRRSAPSTALAIVIARCAATSA